MYLLVINQVFKLPFRTGFCFRLLGFQLYFLLLVFHLVLVCQTRFNSGRVDWESIYCLSSLLMFPFKLICIQVSRSVSDSDNDFDFSCAASADSILDYGQYAISQSGTGHIMYSAATAQSTMDFSTKPINDGVVDSPPYGGKRPLSVCSPSPLKSRTLISSPRVRQGPGGAPQRKLYDDCGLEEEPLPTAVCDLRFNLFYRCFHYCYYLF